MPSLRGRLVRSMVRRLIRPKFRRAGNSIEALRKLGEQLTRYQKVPAGTEVRPVTVEGIPAEWVRGPGVQGDGAVLYLHGGAFVMGSPATHRELAARLSAAADSEFLVLDYRLAPEHPFPAAVQDATSAYRWLLAEGYSPERVALGGDSSGGGLALQTLMALRDDRARLPAAAFLLSPVTDWVRFDGESYLTRAGVDPLNTPEMCKFTASHYVGGNDVETALLSPVHHDLSGLPSLCIHVGDREILLSDSERLADRGRACRVDVELKTWPGMWHVFQTGAAFVPEARRSIAEIGWFVAGRLGSGG